MEEQRKKKGGCCIIAIVILLVLMLLALGIAVYGYNAFLNQIPRVEEEETLSEEEIQAIENETDPVEDLENLEELVEETETTPAEEENATEPQEQVQVIEKDDHIINILLIGQDRRPGEGRQRSDSMILCTINTQKKTLVMTSFLRDLYVDIPTWNGRTYMDNRLNSCYAYGGMGMLDAALKQNFGVQVDHNIEVDFSGFKKVIDVFGGVSLKLSAAEAKVVGVGKESGTYFLNSEQALTYARIRKLDSDFGRTNRQRKVITALLASVRNMNYDQMTAMVNNILPMITTDMSNAEITSYMLEVLPILSQLEIKTQHIPAEGTYRNARVRGMAVLVPDKAANIAILRQTLN